MALTLCSAGGRLLEKMFAAGDERVRAQFALTSDSSPSIEQRERSFERANKDWFDSMEEFTRHRGGCSICRGPKTDDLELCLVGEELARALLNESHDALLKNDAAPNDSAIQGRVSVALDSLLRHKRSCGTCR